MPVTPTYPGVYIEELPSAVRTITAVSTSVTAFVGNTVRGPVNRPVTLTGFGDYERRFGGLAAGSPLSYAIQQFFSGGGSVAVVVRLAKDAEGATETLPVDADNGLKVTAREPGDWGNSLRLSIDHDSPEPDGFNLRVFDLAGGVNETHTGLTMANVESRVNGGSDVVEVERSGTGATPPPSSGTVSQDFPSVPPLADRTITVEGVEPFTLWVEAEDGSAPTSVHGLGLLLERKLRANAQGRRALAAARVRTIGGTRLQVVPGEPDATITFSGDGGLGLGASTQPGAVALGGGLPGEPAGPTEFLGSEDAKTGIHALRDVDDVNLLCLPDASATTFGNDGRIGVLAAAVALCEERRIFLIVDSPETWTNLDRARAGLPNFDPVRSDHAALYFPRIRLTDQLTGQLREFPPSGAIAGIMARTDAERGVWKAPAGTEARLTGVRELTVPLSDPENGLLNPLGVNCLRAFPVVGPVVWGARTLQGADQLASQWKYVPVRRLALMLEESLYRGTKWVVFEPNDETLWGQIRLNVGAFLHTLFQQGAFQGTSARQAYFVKVDKDTTTQDDINRGIVNILVGFAPLKPAEFVIIKIEQLAGQLEG